MKDPVGGVTGNTVLALAPVFTLLVLLAVFRITAWLAVIAGSIVTLLLAIFAWSVPTGQVFARPDRAARVDLARLRGAAAVRLRQTVPRGAPYYLETVKAK